MNTFRSIARFYIDGFRSLSRRGQWLWLMIILKVAILFLVFKLWLMPPSPLAACPSDADKASRVRQQLVK